MSAKLALGICCVLLFVEVSTADAIYRDVVINSARFGNGDEMSATFGKKKLAHVQELEGDDQPQVWLRNPTNTELLILYKGYGSARNEFIQVRLVSPPPLRGSRRVVKTSSFPHFVTGRGIKLDLTKMEVKQRLGQPSKITANGEQFEYGLRLWDAIQTKQKTDGYFGIYKFRNGRLAECHFGWEQP